MADRKVNRTRLLEALRAGDKCQSDLIAELCLGLSSVSRWMQDIVFRKEAHVCRYEVPPHGGPLIAVYRHGPAPEGFVPTRPRIKNQVQRTRTNRRAKRTSGDWDDVLARRRATYWKNKPVQRDALTAALFGGAA